MSLVSSLKLRCNILKLMAMPESQDFAGNDAWGIPQPSKLRDIVMLSHFKNVFPGCLSLQVSCHNSEVGKGPFQ
jgi:hypothetical protein